MRSQQKRNFFFFRAVLIHISCFLILYNFGKGKSKILFGAVPPCPFKSTWSRRKTGTPLCPPNSPYNPPHTGCVCKRSPTRKILPRSAKDAQSRRLLTPVKENPGIIKRKITSHCDSFQIFLFHFLPFPCIFAISFAYQSGDFASNFGYAQRNFVSFPFIPCADKFICISLFFLILCLSCNWPKSRII